MAGSDIYCTVQQQGKVVSVACFHLPGGIHSSARKGYAMLATDGLVAIEPGGSTKPVIEKLQPAMDSPAFGGGKPYGNVLKLGVGDVAAIDQTHMALLVQPSSSGGDAIGVVYLDGHDAPIPGTYTVGISNYVVEIVRVDKVVGGRVTKTTPIYKHPVY
jgi:hypothetical protein